MSHSRIFVVVDCTDSAESLSDQLRLRGFDARMSEVGVLVIGIEKENMIGFEMENAEAERK